MDAAMISTRLLLYSITFSQCILLHIKADSIVIISKRSSNSSYSCYVRNTPDGLEYHLTYNVCFPVSPEGMPNETSDAVSGLPGTYGGQQACVHYECCITSRQLLLGDDGQLGCHRYDDLSPLPRQYSGQRPASMSELRQQPSVAYSLPVTLQSKRNRIRVKRDFSWVSFLEKISFQGRHESTVNKHNEAYFHYNFMNKPSGGSTGRPTAGSPAPTTTTGFSTSTFPTTTLA
ncbi:uncharacterized protein LOC118465994 isoform X1 [Anopheles albimanus]|uniref:Uncharacterized protein n=1 Tax=Anopheles albimanus TaxID=7167 RepID=A0A182FZ89_ANOAL|nr:uncharacterized protein LOC118465994 isoform X1 [Anopheles albimanus]